VTTNAALVRLLQLASPALPVGAFSYSQGLEAAIEQSIVKDEASALAWIEDVLELCVATMEAPLFLRLYDSWIRDDAEDAKHWNALVLASRESSELRSETAQMGYSLARLITDLREAHPFERWHEVSLPAAFSYVAVRWKLERDAALVAYLWSWAENQVLAAMKAVPLGQTAGQRLLTALGARIAECAQRAMEMSDDELSNMAPGLALLSASHETQYSRLFRS
jgi:urease accessory protein